MSYSLKQAAHATGKTKPTILRAIQTGKISAMRHEVTGAWQIEPAELHRIYPASADNVAQQDNSRSEQHDVIASEIAVLRRELQLKDEKLEAEQQERQRERVQLEATIDDLRRRLDAEAEERRKLTAILTDQRTEALEVIAMPPPAPAHVSPAASGPDGVAPAPAGDTDNGQQQYPPRPAKRPPAKAEVSWWRRLMGGR